MWALYLNAHRDDKRYPEAYTWVDLFPEWNEPVHEQTEDQMFQSMLLWAAVTRVKPRR